MDDAAEIVQGALTAASDTDPEDVRRVRVLLAQIADHRARNITRTIYAEGKNTLEDFGISLPPQIKTADYVLGWPMKAVSSLAARCQFDGWVIPGEEQDPFDLMSIAASSSLHTVLPQAISSALIHSCAFLVLDPSGAEGVRVAAVEATQATGVWDRRTNSLSEALTIQLDPQSGVPTSITWYTRERVVTFHLSAAFQITGRTEVPNLTGRVWVEPLVYRPTVARPFGSSRISRAVMSLTDAGVRTVARAEGHAEFFASPQRWATGVEDGAFDMDRWNAVMSRLVVFSKDEDGDTPNLGQFPQMSMQPHFDHLRSLASLFAGETGLPLSALGIVQDNPASAEAIYAAKEDLVIEAQAAMLVWGDALRRLAVTAVMLRDGLTEPPAELALLRTKWRNPATPSIVSAADATAKKVAAIPWLAESDVTLEDLGYDEPTIARLLADKRRAQGGSALDRIMAESAERVIEAAGSGVPA